MRTTRLLVAGGVSTNTGAAWRTGDTWTRARLGGATERAFLRGDALRLGFTSVLVGDGAGALWTGGGVAGAGVSVGAEQPDASSKANLVLHTRVGLLPSPGEMTTLHLVDFFLGLHFRRGLLAARLAGAFWAALGEAAPRVLLRTDAAVFELIWEHLLRGARKMADRL